MEWEIEGMSPVIPLFWNQKTIEAVKKVAYSLFMKFTYEYLLKEKYLDYKLSWYGLGTGVIVYKWLFFL